MSCGIVLALSNDPLSKITVSVTKQEFSTIGYYYTFGSTTKVFLRDPFGLPLYETASLEELKQCPLLRRLAIRPIKPELETAFRLSLAKKETCGLREIKEGIYQLFGFPSTPTKNLSSLGLVSNIISRMGKTLVNSNVNTLYGSGYEDCIAQPSKDKGGIEGTIQVLSYAASFFNQNTSPEITTDGKKLPWQIQSYILDEELFLPLQEFILPSSNEKEIKKAFLKQRPRMEEGIKTFFSMIQDPGFLFLVTKGCYNQGQKLLQDSLVEVTDLLPRVSNFIKNKDLLEEINFQTVKLSALLGKKVDKEEKIDGPLDCFKQVLLGAIERKEKLDLRVLVEIYQELSGEELRFASSKKIKGTYFLSPGTVGIILSSGDRINLPLSNPDLSSFDYETLLEILEKLNAIASDSSYDELRTNLAEELASYSSFSS